MVEEEINATTTTTAATTPPVIHVGADITEEERESLQERLEAQLRHKKKVIGRADGEVGVTDGNAAIWETCCQLTSQLSADLAEQLRYCADSRVVRPVVVPTSTPYRPTDSRTRALAHSRTHALTTLPHFSGLSWSPIPTPSSGASTGRASGAFLERSDALLPAVPRSSRLSSSPAHNALPQPVGST